MFGNLKPPGMAPDSGRHGDCVVDVSSTGSVSECVVKYRGCGGVAAVGGLVKAV
jgi:hypothetical protein